MLAFALGFSAPLASRAQAEPAVIADAGAPLPAEDDGGTDPTVPAALSGPRLVAPAPLAPIEPVYPPEIRARGGSGSVLLRLEIDAGGRVTYAEVLESASPELDAAVLQAVTAAAWSPATRDGAPMPARIVYRQEIAIPAAIAEPAPPAPSAPPAPPPSAAMPTAPQLVHVRGQRSAAERLESSSDAVSVLRLETAKKRTADLAEVLAREPGVSVRRAGSLGADFRLSMNGLYDEQIRTFVDGIPIDLVYAQSLSGLPINLLERAEIYRGVVPIRLGSDALGGAINLVRPERYENAGAASLQFGSFDTQRATLTGRFRDETSHFVMGVEAFVDETDNDYRVDVELPGEFDQLTRGNVRRFHDAYRAHGVAVELGAVETAWAEKLIVQGFTSGYDKELQHDVVMALPYGEVHYAEYVYGGLLRYQHAPHEKIRLDAVMSYAFREIEFVDLSRWVYDWHGERVNMRRVPGEVDSGSNDQVTWEHGLFGRITLESRLAPGHLVTLNTSSQYATRSGDERAPLDPDATDPLRGRQHQLATVTGLEYRARFLTMPNAPDDPRASRDEDFRIENTVFVKWYIYLARARALNARDTWDELSMSRNRFGVGEALRIQLLDWLMFKASYEYATRLPTTDEVFGDGVLGQPNYELRPEASHNWNAGPLGRLSQASWGELIVDVNAFLRDTRDQIIGLTAEGKTQRYWNLSNARSIGAEGAIQWTSPKRYVSLQASMTYQDQRNHSTRPPFDKYRGDRIPNRPWLFASGSAALRFAGLLSRGDALEPFYTTRYTQSFYRGWASIGWTEFKEVVPSQLNHDLGVTYGTSIAGGHLDLTLEVQNVTDAKLYDMFGVQRPGRAVFAKLSGEI